MKRILLLVFSVFLFSQTKAQTITIAQARLAATGTSVTVKGIVLNGSELGNSRYIWDGTAGLDLYGTNLSTTNRGDTLLATGTVAPYSGLFELTPVTFTKLNAGNPLPTANVQSVVNGFAGNFEANLMQFNNVAFTATGTFASSTAYTITDGTNTAQVYCSSTALAGHAIPVGNVNLVGIMSVHSSVYQLLPRDINDIQFNGNPPIITTPLIQTNITQTAFTVSFNTQNNGSTIINYGLTPTNLNMNAANSTAQTTTHSANLTGLTAATIYYVQGISISSTNDTSKSAVTAMVTASASSGNIKVYFDFATDQTKAQYGNVARTLTNTFADTLIAYINRATSTLDIAIYNLDNNLGVITALNAATTRGVQVRMVFDPGVSPAVMSSINTTYQYQTPSTRLGIMHNKFMIIDAGNPALATVWTGSTNWTQEQLTQDKNNIIIIQDQSLAKSYQVEFEEIFVNQYYGNAKSNNTPHEFMIGGKRVESYFSPTDGVTSQIKQHIATANYDLYTAVMSYTKTDIAYEIVDTVVNKNGAYFAGLVNDTTSSGEPAAFNDINNHISSHPELIYNGAYIFHHKYAVIDPNDACSDPMVITGSHNWSSAAETVNDENTLIVHDSTIANLYYQEFAQRYADNGGTLTAKTYMPCPKSASGITSVNNNIAVQLFPNPSQDNSTLLLNENAGNKGVVSICDITGKELIHINFNNQNKIEIASSNLQSGIYLVNVNTEKGRTTLKWVLNK